MCLCVCVVCCVLCVVCYVLCVMLYVVRVVGIQFPWSFRFCRIVLSFSFRTLSEAWAVLSSEGVSLLKLELSVALVNKMTP